MDGIGVGYLEPNMLDGENEANHKAANSSNSSDESKESIQMKTKRSSAEGSDVQNSRCAETTIPTYPRKPLRETVTVDNIKAFILVRSKFKRWQFSPASF